MRLPVLLLVLPLLGLNLAFTGALPDAYQPEIFDAGLPAWVPPVENGLRLALFGLMLALPIGAGRAGWAIFLAGTLAYAASWAVPSLAPASAWSQSLIGFTAPAWTPAVWLTGIGLIGRAGPPLARRLYWVLVTTFLAAHVGHAALVWARL